MVLSIRWLIVLVAFAAGLSGPDCSAQRRRRTDEAAPGNSPSARLAPFVERLGGMLLLTRAEGAEGVVSSPGRIAVLRGEFVGECAKAPPERQPVLNAAITVCDLLNKALDERRQTAANAKATKKVTVSQDGKGKAAKKKAKEADAFFDQAIIAFWKNRKTDLINQVNAAYSRLQALEARAAPARP